MMCMKHSQSLLLTRACFSTHMQDLCQDWIASHPDSLCSPHPFHTSALKHDKLNPGAAYAFLIIIKKTPFTWRELRLNPDSWFQMFEGTSLGLHLPGRWVGDLQPLYGLSTVPSVCLKNWNTELIPQDGAWLDGQQQQDLDKGLEKFFAS